MCVCVCVYKFKIHVLFSFKDCISIRNHMFGYYNESNRSEWLVMLLCINWNFIWLNHQTNAWETGKCLKAVDMDNREEYRKEKVLACLRKVTCAPYMPSRWQSSPKTCSWPEIYVARLFTRDRQTISDVLPRCPFKWIQFAKNVW